jgi:hypothetical protein
MVTHTPTPFLSSDFGSFSSSQQGMKGRGCSQWNKLASIVFCKHLMAHSTQKGWLGTNNITFYHECPKFIMRAPLGHMSHNKVRLGGTKKPYIL